MASDVYNSLGAYKKKFLSWQMRIIIVTMIGYAIFYFVRKNFSLAMPGLTAEYGISNKSFGWMIFAGSLVYGFSRFANGYLVDRIKGRIVMALGLLLCALANLCFGFGFNISEGITGMHDGPRLIETFAFVMGIVIVVNQYFQGMGYPPCARILPHWIHPSELATKMSIWNCSHSIGAAFAVIVCGYIMGAMGENLSANPDVVNRIMANLTDNKVADAATQAVKYAEHVGAWKWCFWIPAGLALAGAIFLFVGLRDNPTEVGLPELPGTSLGDYEEASKNPKARRKFEMVMVWKNRWVWTFCIANLFVYIVRMGILDWGPKFLTESRDLSIESAGWTVAAFEIAGIVGTLFAGWATDKLFAGKGHRMCVMCMLGATIFMIVFWLLPASAGITATAAVLVGAGFCIYGPQALIGIELGNQATKEASARANGLAGILGYLGSGLSGLLVGYVADIYGWTAVFETIIVVSIIGMIVLLTMWNAPRDGYARAQSIKYDSIKITASSAEAAYSANDAQIFEDAAEEAKAEEKEKEEQDKADDKKADDNKEEK